LTSKDLKITIYHTWRNFFFLPFGCSSSNSHGYSTPHTIADTNCTKKFSCSLQFYPKLSFKKISANGRRQVVRVLYLVLITLAGPVKWRERKVWATGNRRARKSHMIEAAKISCREGGGAQGVCHVFRKRNDQNVYRRNEKQKLLTRNLNNHEIYSKNS
jgi:hypothetical protein